MDVREVTDREQWEGFVRRQPESQFLQSWAWGEFQRAVGNRVFRFGVERGGRLVAAAQAILRNHGFGIRSLAVYRGPIINPKLPVEEYTAILEDLFATLEGCGREYGAAYLHLEPPFDRHAPAAALLTDRPSWIASGSDQPAQSLLIRLEPRIDELLSAMHEKTRYNIRLAERKGVTVNSSNEPHAIEPFLALLPITAQRDRIHVHPLAHFQRMAEVLCPAGLLIVTTAQYEGRAIAANLVVRYGDTVTYLHGASGSEHRNVMAPHLLQWKQIEWARKKEYAWYDFWGVAPREAGPEHPWAGISRFKRGFGGEYRSYLGAMDRPISTIRYQLVRWRRGLRG
jgi:lipid II:glycine glycyltransferase (peptidoglycan interpeptide bridge formation enzyme)